MAPKIFSPKKTLKKDRYRLRGITKVDLCDAYERWTSLKEEIGLIGARSDESLAFQLMDFWSKGHEDNNTLTGSDLGPHSTSSAMSYTNTEKSKKKWALTTVEESVKKEPDSPNSLMDFDYLDFSNPLSKPLPAVTLPAVTLPAVIDIPANSESWGTLAACIDSNTNSVKLFLANRLICQINTQGGLEMTQNMVTEFLEVPYIAEHVFSTMVNVYVKIGRIPPLYLKDVPVKFVDIGYHTTSNEYDLPKTEVWAPKVKQPRTTRGQYKKRKQSHIKPKKSKKKKSKEQLQKVKEELISDVEDELSEKDDEKDEEWLPSENEGDILEKVSSDKESTAEKGTTVEKGGTKKISASKKPRKNERAMCNICQKTFYSKCFMKKHKLVHHDRTHVFCYTCSKLFTSMAQLLEHRKTHVRKVCLCPHCGRQMSRDNLKKHIILTHSVEEPLVECTHPGCGKKMVKESLRMHEKTHIKDKICSYCARAFSGTSQLERHVISIHTNERKYPCQWENCGKAFKTTSALLYHTRIHTGFKPFKCKLCGDYSSHQKAALNWHMKHYHGDSTTNIHAENLAVERTIEESAVMMYPESEFSQMESIIAVNSTYSELV